VLDPGLVYACITHVPPWIDPPSWVSTIHLGAVQGDGRLNLRDLAPDWEPHHAVLGATAGSFALRRYILAHRPNATRVGLCGYRKFVSRRRISTVRDPKYRSMDVVVLATLHGDAYARHLDPGESSFLLSAPRRFTRLPWYRRGYLKEYARDHEVEDLLRFAAEAVAQGVLGRKEVQDFFDEDVIIPGGVELGVYPADFWLTCIGQIEGVARACVQHWPEARAGYQARSWSFCAERLGSWLLLKRLRRDAVTGLVSRHVRWWNQRTWTRANVGQLNLLTRDAEHKGYVGGT
jgi:hypothetical protein